MDPSTSPKRYWSVMMFFYNKKVPYTPVMFHKNRFVTNFKEKAELFYSFVFAKQCSIRDNGSKIASALHLKTDKSLSNMTSTEKDIKKV